MKFVTVDVVIEGMTALLQHRFPDKAGINGDTGKGTRRVHKDYGTPREQAEEVCYRNKQKELYHPSSSILRLLCDAGAAHKQKGSRKSLKWIVPAAVRMVTEDLQLFVPNGGEEWLRANDFEVDSRPVVVPSTKGRIVRHRPRLDEWQAHFRVAINELVLAEETIHELLVEGGMQIGIGDYRPQKTGPFGIFRVISWDRLTED